MGGLRFFAAWGKTGLITLNSYHSERHMGPETGPTKSHAPEFRGLILDRAMQPGAPGMRPRSCLEAKKHGGAYLGRHSIAQS